MEIMQTIVVALDFSDATDRILSEAIELARATKKSLLLLHVLEPVPQFVGGEMAMEMIQPPAPVDTTADEQRIAQIEAKVKAQGVDVRAVVTVGIAVDEILSHAQDTKAAYIVVGSHGHGALYHLFSGSVVTGVLKSAPCPVVVVPVRKNS